MIDVELILEVAAKVAATEQALHDWDATWRYDEPIMNALAPFLPKEPRERRSILRDIENLARKRAATCRKGTTWTGYDFVAAIVASKVAWLTPGFADAYRIDRYGF